MNSKVVAVSSDKRRRRNFSFSLGQPRKLSGLKARFISKPESSRAFSAHIRSNQKNPRALPQVRHGESVLWRTGNDTAPSALNTYASAEANAALIV
jgi:hypothetical protein